jgi:hypothetical protein
MSSKEARTLAFEGRKAGEERSVLDGTENPK